MRAKPYFSLGFSFAGVAVRIPGLPEPGADAAAPVLLARPGDGGPGRPQTVTPLSFAYGFLDFSQKRGACLEPPTTPIASEAGGWERAVSTAFPKLLTLGGVGGGLRLPGKPGAERGRSRRHTGMGAAGGQIRRGKRPLSFPSCKQRDNAENATVLMWYAAYGGEGSVLLRVFVQGRL